jgi:hypothetical protein
VDCRLREETLRRAHLKVWQKESLVMKSLVLSLALAVAGLGFVATPTANAQWFRPRTYYYITTPPYTYTYYAYPGYAANYYWPNYSYYNPGYTTYYSYGYPGSGWYPSYSYPSYTYPSYSYPSYSYGTYPMMYSNGSWY